MRIILASASPRRSQLLGEAGVDFEVIPSEAEERADKALPPQAYTESLARFKAEDVYAKTGGVVLGADTVVVFDGKVLGKPTSQGDARATLRARIEFITSLFAEGEVDEIWITFPDPQLRTKRAKKRLTAPIFLEYYSKLLAKDGWINLKTDSQHLFQYTSAVIEKFGLECEVANNDIYGSGYADEVLSVKTAYEQMYLERGLPITYTRFQLGERTEFPMFDWEGDDILEKDAEEERALQVTRR